jgi:hypothetical protein
MWVSKKELEKTGLGKKYYTAEQVIAERIGAIKNHEQGKLAQKYHFDVIANFGITDPQGKMTELSRIFHFKTIEEARKCIKDITKGTAFAYEDQHFAVDFAPPVEWVYTDIWIEEI